MQEDVEFIKEQKRIEAERAAAKERDEDMRALEKMALAAAGAGMQGRTALILKESAALAARASTPEEAARLAGMAAEMQENARLAREDYRIRELLPGMEMSVLAAFKKLGLVTS
jgi:hypothetical protein